MCGLYWPPLRLSWIKSLSHPRYHQCFDPNCLEGQSCLGNHIKVEHVPGVASESSRWHFGYNDKVCLRLNIIHNKNDRRSSRSNYQIGFNLPDCHVTKLFFAHIKEGHRLITLSQPDPIVRLFVSEEGNGFSGVYSNRSQGLEFSFFYLLSQSPPPLSNQMPRFSTSG